MSDVSSGSPLGLDASVRGVLQSVPESDEIKEARVAQMVRELFYRSRDARRPLMSQWKKNYRVLNNKTWQPRAEPWMPAPEISNIWPIIASLVAWITDQRPTTETTPVIPPFSPEADFYDKIAEHMNATLRSTFVGNDLDAEIEKMLWDVCTYQIGFMKTTWEPWLADGYGDSAFRRVDPFTLYLDPFARSMRELNHIIEAKIMTLTDLDRAWPGSVSRVMPGQTEDIDEAPHRMDSNHSSASSPRVNLGPIGPSTYSRFAPSQRASTLNVHDDPVVVVLEAWIRTHEIITHKEDPNIQEGTARVVDRWKCIVTCGNTVLMDEFADDIFGFTTHPYDRMVLFETGEMYGPCLVEFLTSPQESINRMLANIEQNIMLVGNPILFESPRANGVTKSNRPGGRVKGNRDQVGWLEPPTLHPDQINLISYYESKIETISGLSAIVRGFSPTGRNSTEVMSSVQDSAFVRVRATLRNLERCLRGCTAKMAGNIAEFYTEPRMIATVGQDGTRTRLALKSRHFYTLASADEPDGTPMRFQVMADAGSEHPTSRGARQAEAERLFAMGAIDEIEVLKASKWPNWREVATRVLDMKAQAGALGQPPGKRQATRS